MDINIDIVDYLGKLLDDSVIISLSLNYKEEYYDAIFYYKEGLITIAVDEKFEDKIGCKIEDWNEYSNLMLKIIEKIPPYTDILRQVEYINIDDVI